jgi:hypothetical protein
MGGDTAREREGVRAGSPSEVGALQQPQPSIITLLICSRNAARAQPTRTHARPLVSGHPRSPYRLPPTAIETRAVRLSSTLCASDNGSRSVHRLITLLHVATLALTWFAEAECRPASDENHSRPQVLKNETSHDEQGRARWRRKQSTLSFQEGVGRLWRHAPSWERRTRLCYERLCR